MKISLVGKLILTAPFNGKCDACGNSFKFTLNDDTYVYLPTGIVRIKCPHCGQEYDMSIKPEMSKEEQ